MIAISDHARARYAQRVYALDLPCDSALLWMWYNGTEATDQQMTVFGAERRQGYRYRVAARPGCPAALIVASRTHIVTVIEQK
jgi:hypothetical protein